LVWGAISAPAGDWPQWRGPNRDGVSTETEWLDYWPPQTVWTQGVLYGYSSVAITNGKLYTLGSGLCHGW